MGGGQNCGQEIQANSSMFSKYVKSQRSEEREVAASHAGKRGSTRIAYGGHRDRGYKGRLASGAKTREGEKGGQKERGTRISDGYRKSNGPTRDKGGLNTAATCREFKKKADRARNGGEGETNGLRLEKKLSVLRSGRINGPPNAKNQEVVVNIGKGERAGC